jgi:hypothetical protein
VFPNARPKGPEVTDALTGSQLAELRQRRHVDRTRARSERLAARRTEVLDPGFVADALLSKVGIQHCMAALHAHARGNTGQVNKRDLRRALEKLFTDYRRATNGSSR